VRAVPRPLVYLLPIAKLVPALRDTAIANIENGVPILGGSEGAGTKTSVQECLGDT
jgi:hypothetical protein